MTWPLETDELVQVELAADPDWPCRTDVIGGVYCVLPITDPDLLSDEATPHERWLVERGQRIA